MQASSTQCDSQAHQGWLPGHRHFDVHLHGEQGHILRPVVQDIDNWAARLAVEEYGTLRSWLLQAILTPDPGRQTLDTWSPV